MNPKSRHSMRPGSLELRLVSEYEAKSLDRVDKIAGMMMQAEQSDVSLALYPSLKQSAAHHSDQNLGSRGEDFVFFTDHQIPQADLENVVRDHYERQDYLVINEEYGPIEVRKEDKEIFVVYITNGSPGDVQVTVIDMEFELRRR